jgi:hypothetical protein
METLDHMHPEQPRARRSNLGVGIGLMAIGAFLLLGN